MYEEEDMYDFRGKFSVLYLESLRLVIPVVSQISFICISLYNCYSDFSDTVDVRVTASILLSLAFLSNDIVFYCMSRLEKEGHLVSKAIIRRNYKFKKLLLILFVYVLPISYLWYSLGVLFALEVIITLLAFKGLIYYVVREYERLKIESLVSSIGFNYNKKSKVNLNEEDKPI